MGFRSTWIAVQRARRDSALKRFALREGEPVDMVETGLYGLSVGDWYVVIGSGSDHLGLLAPDDAKALSGDSGALFWFADDGLMQSHLSAYREGTCSWSLDSENAAARIEGAAPEIVMQTLRAQRSLQEAEADPGVDSVYEVAHLVGQALVGFRHDEDAPEGAELRELHAAA